MVWCKEEDCGVLTMQAGSRAPEYLGYLKKRGDASAKKPAMISLYRSSLKTWLSVGQPFTRLKNSFEDPAGAEARCKKEPPRATACFSPGFPMKIVIIRYNERRFIFYHCDERRRPKTGLPVRRFK
jgi:hypothetical protein